MDLVTNSQKLGTTARSLAAVSAALNSELERLASASTTLTNSWAGDAKAAYETRYRAFARDAADHAAALREIAEALGSLAEEYAAADAKGAAAQPG